MSRVLMRSSSYAISKTILPEVNSIYGNGIDTRNITEPSISIQKVHRNELFYSHLRTLENAQISNEYKKKIALLCLEEILYPDDKPSKYIMNLMNGGLFGGDFDDDDFK